MDNVLQGKSALVIGGTSGIGYCLVQSLLQESVSVVMQGQSNSKQVTSLCSQGNVACFICDLQKASYMDELCKYANAADILCIAYVVRYERAALGTCFTVRRYGNSYFEGV